MNQLRSRTRVFQGFTGYHFHVLFDTLRTRQKQFKQAFLFRFFLQIICSRTFSRAQVMRSFLLFFFAQVGILLHGNVFRIRQE